MSFVCSVQIGAATRKRAMGKFDAEHEGKNMKAVDFDIFRHTALGRKAKTWDVRYAI